MRRSTLLTSATLAAGAVGIFLVPWFVPYREPVNSLSYTYGFNNFASWIALALLLAALSLIRLSNGTGRVDRGLANLFPDRVPRPDRTLRLAAGAMAALGAAAQIACFAVLPTNHFGEMLVHAGRLDLMTIGRRPYADFQFNFGPGMLYVPYGLQRLAAGALSIDTSYIVWLAACWVIGTLLLYYIVRHLAEDVWKTAVFICIALIFFNPTMMGLQYTPVRYFLPIASLMFIHRSVSDGGAWRAAKIALGGLLLPCAALAFSPDAGIATVTALLLYFVALARTRFRRFSWCAAAPLLALPLARLLFGPDYLESVRAYSNSVAGFPVLPTPGVVACLLAVTAVLPSLAAAGLRNRTAAGALALALAVVLAVAFVPALGRCDLVHVSFNGAGVLLLAIAMVTTVRSARASRAVLGAYLILFPASTVTAMMWHSYGARVLQALHAARQEAHTQTHTYAWSDIDSPRRLPYLKPTSLSPDLFDLLPDGKIGLPFGASEDVARFLKAMDRFVPEYWPGELSYLGTRADVDRKLRDLEPMNAILVPRELYLVDNFLSVRVGDDLTAPSTVDPALHRRTAAHVLTTVNLFPVWLPMARHPAMPPELQIMSEIAKRYISIGEFRQMIVARKKTAERP